MGHTRREDIVSGKRLLFSGISIESRSMNLLSWQQKKGDWKKGEIVERLLWGRCVTWMSQVRQGIWNLEACVCGKVVVVAQEVFRQHGTKTYFYVTRYSGQPGTWLASLTRSQVTTLNSGIICLSVETAIRSTDKHVVHSVILCLRMQWHLLDPSCSMELFCFWAGSDTGTTSKKNKRNLFSNPLYSQRFSVQPWAQYNTLSRVLGIGTSGLGVTPWPQTSCYWQSIPNDFLRHSDDDQWSPFFKVLTPLPAVMDLIGLHNIYLPGSFAPRLLQAYVTLGIDLYSL